MYEITIKETRQERKIIGKTWSKLGSIEKERDERFVAANSKEPRTYIGDEMGYTPETETVEDVTIIRLHQQIETLNLARVIQAINEL